MRWRFGQSLSAAILSASGLTGGSWPFRTLASSPPLCIRRDRGCSLQKDQKGPSAKSATVGHHHVSKILHTVFLQYMHAVKYCTPRLATFPPATNDGDDGRHARRSQLQSPAHDKDLHTFLVTHTTATIPDEEPRKEHPLPSNHPSAIEPAASPTHLEPTLPPMARWPREPTSTSTPSSPRR